MEIPGRIFSYVFTGTTKSQDTLYELDTWP